jgi:hypothetical protein
LHLCLLLAAACGGAGDDTDSLRCVASLPTSCAPDLDPTFDSLYTNVISQRCGTSDSGNTCHGKNGNAQSDLKLTDANTAYQALLGSRVIPGDAHCSPLMERLESDDPAKRMPRGENNLAAGLRCAFQQWIEKGAPR